MKIQDFDIEQFAEGTAGYEGKCSFWKRCREKAKFMLQRNNGRVSLCSFCVNKYKKKEHKTFEEFWQWAERESWKTRLTIQEGNLILVAILGKRKKNQNSPLINTVEFSIPKLDPSKHSKDFQKLVDKALIKGVTLCVRNPRTEQRKMLLSLGFRGEKVMFLEAGKTQKKLQKNLTGLQEENKIEA